MNSPPKSNNTTATRFPSRSSSRLKRKPFSDLTNTTTPTPSPSSKPNPKHQSKPNYVPESNATADPQPETSSAAVGEEIEGASVSTPKSKEIVKDFCDDDSNICMVYSRRVKTRRKGKGGKEKAVEAASTLSCPPLGRTISIGQSMNLKAHVDGLHKDFSVVSDKTRKTQCAVPSISLDYGVLFLYERSDLKCSRLNAANLSRITFASMGKRHRSMPTKIQKPILPPDFVEEQKAYFSEIDAFELPVEEVSDSNELE